MQIGWKKKERRGKKNSLPIETAECGSGTDKPGLFHVTADALCVLLFNSKQQAWSLILCRIFL